MRNIKTTLAGVGAIVLAFADAWPDVGMPDINTFLSVGFLGAVAAGIGLITARDGSDPEES
jgi:hypothetical protein